MPASFICTCRVMGPNDQWRGRRWYDKVDLEKSDSTGCVVHDRVARLQFERDEALQDKERLKNQINDLVDTLNQVASLVGHRGETKSGDALLASVQRVVDDLDFKHKQWAKLTGDDFGTRAMKLCNECGDRVSICLHAQKAQDDAFLLALKQQSEIAALKSQIDLLKKNK